jgi:transcriptional regulator with XRE-family HTH domain
MKKGDAKTSARAAATASDEFIGPVTDDLFTNRGEAGIAYRLELTRAVKGGTQKNFAAKAGIKDNTYSQWKSGTNQISLDAANALCDAHTLTLDWIYRGDVAGLDKSDREALIAAHNVRKKSAHR